MTVSGQAQNYTLNKTIVFESGFIEVDFFGNIYLVENDKVSKYNSEAQILYTYNADVFEISSFDVSNPLKPIIYSSNATKVIFLDQKLSVLNSVYLNEVGFDDVAIICSAGNEHFWIFDNNDFKLKKVNKTFQIVTESNSFYNTFNEFSTPTLMTVNNQELYVFDNENIKIFDQYGTFIKNISIKGVSFQVFNNDIVYLENDMLVKYSHKSLQKIEMILPKIDNINRVKLIKDKVIIQAGGKVYIYSIN